MKNFLRFKILVGLLGVLLSSSVWAITYYVDNGHVSASNVNSGTESLPWLTIQHGFTQLSAGDILIVKTGVYTAVGTGSRLTPAFNPPSGTVGNPVTIKAEGLVQLRHSSGTGSLIGTYSRDYVTWDGFHIDENYINTSSDTGPATIWFSSFVTIKNCEFIGINATWSDNHSAIRVEYSTDIEIINNDIHDFRMSQGSRNGSAIMTYHTNRILIENNEVYDSDGGIFIKGGDDQGEVTIRFNYIHDTATDGIAFGGVGDSVPWGARVYSNIILNTPTSGITLISYAPVGPVSVHIYNNVFGGGLRGIFARGGSVGHDDIIVHNNIFLDWAGNMLYTEDLPNLAAFSFEHNVYRSAATFASVNYTTYSFDAAWYSTFGLDQATPASIDSDPLFVNEATGDYHLQAGSPAIGLGVDTLDLDGDGSTTDIVASGAYVTGAETIGLLGGTIPVLEAPRNFTINSCCN